MKVSKVNCANSPAFGANVGGLLSKAANINSWHQRAALGVSAILLQPIIDIHNKDVDKKTRTLSTIRSLSKASVGMMTGIAVRAGSMQLVKQGFKSEKFTEAIAKITARAKTPEALEASRDFIKNGGGAKKYSAALGTIIALGVMLFTNFAVDAPLTNKLTNFLSKKYEASHAGGANDNKG